MTERVRPHLELENIDPPITRDVEVDADVTLFRLHEVLQLLFGWREAHLHEYTDADPGARPFEEGHRWGMRDEDAPPEVVDDHRVTLHHTLGEGPLWYLYDVGDGWCVRITVVSRGARRRVVAPVLLLGGELRGPWEDDARVLARVALR